MEGRRKKALDYLVEKFYESKMREEEHRRKLESYGRVRGWFYKRSRNLRDAGMIFKEVILKPVGMALGVSSSVLSYLLAVSTAPKIHRFTNNVVVGGIITFSIAFCPIIIAESLYAHYVSKEVKKRLREEYGIEV